MLQPCIGLLEFNSIAAGIEATDAMIKQAPIEVLISRTICPGKFIVLITGDVADVESALARGKEDREEVIVDELILPNAHPQLFPAIAASTKIEELDAVGIIETFSVAAAIVAADIAAKRASVTLIELRLAYALGGKAYVTMTGEVSNVEASVRAGADSAREKGLLTREVVIAQPHPSMLQWLCG